MALNLWEVASAASMVQMTIVYATKGDEIMSCPFSLTISASISLLTSSVRL